MAAWHARAAAQGAGLGALAERLALPLALLLLANMYLLGWRPLGEVVVAGLAILAVVALAGGVLAPRLGYGMLRWLGGGAVVVLVGGLISPAVTMAAAGRGAWLLALAAACLVVACLLLRRWPAERLLRWLFLAGAVSATVSAGWFLAHGLAGTERLIPLGRAHNPIPAAAALAAAGLAGVALWRGKALAAPAALAGLVAIFLAMLLTWRPCEPGAGGCRPCCSWPPAAWCRPRACCVTCSAPMSYWPAGQACARTYGRARPR